MKILKSKRGEIAFESVLKLVVSLLVVSFALHLFPCFTAKQQLNTYASELIRTAEIRGCVGEETSKRAKELSDDTGLNPSISWSKHGEIPINEKITVTCTVEKDIGLWGGFGSFPVTLTSTASGRSEVYWK